MKEEINCDETLTAIQNPLEQSSPPIISVKNHIYLYNDINTTVTRALFVAMHEMATGIIQTATDNNTEINPIVLHINSVGGSCSEALAIVQCIKDIQNGTIHKIGNIPIKIPIYTVIEGEADSAASLIACVGTHRSISKYALSLLHDVRQISAGAVEKVDDIEISAKNLGMFRRKFYDIYLEHSKLTEEQLKDICSKEDYSTPQELLDWGIVDEII